MAATERIKGGGKLAVQLYREYSTCSTELTKAGLLDDVNFSSLNRLSAGKWSINLRGADFSQVLKERSYSELYGMLRKERAFCFLLPDGAMVQLYYEGVGNRLTQSRLAYLPSPSLEPFQHDPDLYLGDAQFVDIVGHQVTPVPIRFDFDNRLGVAVDVAHPVSHLTLGQYRHCRIPATHPISPCRFLDFIIRNFYSSPDFVDFIPPSFSPNMDRQLPETISVNERNIPFFNIY